MSGSRPSLNNSATPSPPSTPLLYTHSHAIKGVQSFCHCCHYQHRRFAFSSCSRSSSCLWCTCVCSCMYSVCTYVICICVSLFSSDLFCSAPRFVAYFTFAFVSTQFKCFTFHALHKINNNAPCCCFCSSYCRCCCCFCHVFIIINRAAS